MVPWVAVGSEGEGATAERVKARGDDLITFNIYLNICHIFEKIVSANYISFNYYR